MPARLHLYRIRSILAGLALAIPAIASAGVLFSDGAEGYTSADDAVARGPWANYDQSGGSVAPSKNYAHTGSQSLRICYGSNEAQAYMGIQLRPGMSHLFFRWWELRERAGDFSGAVDYDWAGEKFNRLRSATIGTTGVDYPLGWGAAGGGFGSSGTTDAGAIGIFGNSTASNGADMFSYNYPMRRGEWHMFEVEYDLGTVGSANGSLRMWIDDKLVAQRTGVTLLPKTTATIDDIWVGGWYSGNGDPAGGKACRYVDDVVVSTSKIGFGDGGSSPSAPAPNPPTQETVN
jgi:hypothetical protein